MPPEKDNWSPFQRRAKIPADMEPATALRNLHLIGEDGRMTHAGAWLLARDIRKFNVSAHVSCGLFMGTVKARILDRRDFHRDVYSMIDDVVAWILSKINVEYIIKHVKREERPELPEEAIREAVVNALAHRDYRSAANVQIYLFKDRLEVVSPGGLPAGMTEAALGIKSIPRNPLLFGILHRMEAVEQIGSGIRRIRELCREHGVAEPAIEVSEHWVTTTFPRPTAQDGDQDAAQVDDPRVFDKKSDNSNRLRALKEKMKDLSEQVTAQVTAEVTAQVVLYCEKPRSAKELMGILGLKHWKTFQSNYLQPLLDDGWLEMTMPDKHEQQAEVSSDRTGQKAGGRTGTRAALTPTPYRKDSLSSHVGPRLTRPYLKLGWESVYAHNGQDFGTVGLLSRHTALSPELAA